MTGAHFLDSSDDRSRCFGSLDPFEALLEDTLEALHDLLTPG